MTWVFYAPVISITFTVSLSHGIFFCSAFPPPPTFLQVHWIFCQFYIDFCPFSFWFPVSSLFPGLPESGFVVIPPPCFTSKHTGSLRFPSAHSLPPGSHSPPTHRLFSLVCHPLPFTGAYLSDQVKVQGYFTSKMGLVKSVKAVPSNSNLICDFFSQVTYQSTQLRQAHRADATLSSQEIVLFSKNSERTGCEIQITESMLFWQQLKYKNIIDLRQLQMKQDKQNSEVKLRGTAGCRG